MRITAWKTTRFLSVVALAGAAAVIFLGACGGGGAPGPATAEDHAPDPDAGSSDLPAPGDALPDTAGDDADGAHEIPRTCPTTPRRRVRANPGSRIRIPGTRASIRPMPPSIRPTPLPMRAPSRPTRNAEACPGAGAHRIRSARRACASALRRAPSAPVRAMPGVQPAGPASPSRGAPQARSASRRPNSAGRARLISTATGRCRATMLASRSDRLGASAARTVRPRTPVRTASTARTCP